MPATLVLIAEGSRALRFAIEGERALDGLEVMRHLKRIPETKDIPVIAFTGEQLTDLDYARGRGFDRIVLKEEGLEALENEIAGMIAMC